MTELEARWCPAPVAVNDAYSGHFDTTWHINAASGVLVNDTGGATSVWTGSLPSASHGSITLHSDGSFDYTPTTGYIGSDSFQYYCYDGVNHSASPATVSLTITDTAPTATGDSLHIHSSFLNVNPPGVLSNDSDPDGDSLTAVLVTNVSHGSLTLSSGGSVFYTPNGGYTGTDSFTYQATDGGLSSSTVTVTITDAAPVAVGETYSTGLNQTLNVSASGVLGNDSDSDGDTLTPTLVSNASHGNVTLNSNGSLSYVPAPGFRGVDTFTYKDSDGLLNSNTVTDTILVDETAPVATADSYVLHGGALTIAAAHGVLVNDTDADSDPLTAVLVANVSHGSLTLNSDGSFTYTRTSGSGGDSFTYAPNDGFLNGNTVTVTLAAPTLSLTATSPSVTVGSSTSINVATGTDPDLALSGASFSGTILWGDGSSTSIPASGGNGVSFNTSTGAISVSASHTYDSYGSYTVSVTLNDTVNSLSASPSPNTIATVTQLLSLSVPSTQSYSDGATITTLSPGSGYTVSYSGGGTLVYTATGLPPGLVIDPSNGHMTGTIAVGASANGPYQTVLLVSDNTYSASGQFTWNVSSPISVMPPSNQSNAEGDTPSLSISASGGGTKSYAATGLPNGLHINTSTGSITGTVAVGDAALGPYSVTATVSDGTDSSSTTFTWTITTSVTLDPILDQTSTEGDSISLSTSSTGSSLVFTAAGLPPGLSISKTTGTISGTMATDAAAFGPYFVTVTAANNNASASQSFTWNVASPITFAPVADQTNNEGDSVSLTVSASGGGTKKYGAVGLPGGLSINASSGAITGTVSVGAAANGPYTVVVLANDGTYTEETSFSWNVNSPVTITTPDDQSNAEGDSPSLTVTGSGSGSLTYSASGLPTGMSINSSTGAITGTISAAGSFTPTVSVTNGTYSASAQFNWPVNGVIGVNVAASTTYNSGDAASVPVSVSGGGTPTFSASGLPTGLSINSSTGIISGTISASAGDYTATISVTDGTNTTKLPLDWTVFPSSTIVVTNPGDQSNTDGDTVSWTVSSSYSGGGTRVYAADGLPPGLSINTSTGHISGTINDGDAGFSSYYTTITVTDGSDSDSQSFNWNVSSPISLTNPGTQTNAEGDSISLSLSASYGGTITYAALGLPPGLSINASTGAISGTMGIGAAANGPYAVTVEAESGTHWITQDFTWNVSSPISITTPADQTNAEGDTVSLSISASGSGTLSYYALGLPMGLKINASTGSITGTVALGAAALGPYYTTIVVENGTYANSTSFNWNVSGAISITTPADQTSNEGDTVSLSISASGGGTKTYAATGLPAGLTISSSTGTISGTVAVGAALNGPYFVTVLAEDGTNSSSTSFTWNVNSPITIATVPDQSNNAGSSVSLTVSASGSGSLVYSASGLPSGLSINSSTGAISGTLSAGGFWQPLVTVTNGTYTNNFAFNWSVGSPITITDQGAQSSSEGDTVSVQITATDTAAGTLTYTISSLPTGLTYSSSTGLISGTISSGAYASGPFTTTVSVSDGTHTAVDSFEWDVLPAGPVVLLNPGDQTNTAGDQLAFFLQASDTNAATVMYSASGLPSGLHVNPFTGLVFGTIDLAASSGSPYSVTVQAADGSNHVTQTFSWTVNAAGTVTMTNPGDQTNSEGDSVSLSISASGGGTKKYLAFGLPPGLVINASSGSITGTVAIGASFEGPYTVTVVADDGTHPVAAQTFAWTVNNPITITQTDDQTNTEGDSVSLTISASGSGTLKYAALGLPAGLSMNAGTGTITGTVAVGAANNGPYEVTVVVENGTSSATESFEWNVSSPVSFTQPDDQANADGDSISLTVTASGGGTLKYAAEGLPPGLSINASTGAITGTLGTGDSNLVSYFPTIIANDGTSISTVSFEWDISGAVTITDPGDQTNTTGDAITLQVQATGTSLKYAASGLPAGLSLNTSSGLISGTISAGTDSFVTTISVEDGTSTVSDTFTWTVTTAGSVTLTTPSNQSNTEGDSISSFTLSASGSGTLHYFAVGLPAGVTLNASSGAFGGTVAVGDAAFGPYSVIVIATNGTNFAEEVFTWTVSDPVTITAVPDQTGTENTSGSYSISASGGGTLVYTAVGLPPGLKINTSTGAISGTVALGAATLGTYTVLVTVNDGTSSASTTFNWGIGGAITLAPIADQSNLEGDTVSLSVSASGGGTIRYAAFGLPAGLSINTSTGTITGTIAAGTSWTGVFSVIVTANDGTNSASQSFTWNVGNPITITDPAFVFNQGDTVSEPMHATSVHGGTITWSAIGLPLGLVINATTGLISGTIGSTIVSAGVFVATVWATNGVSNAFLSLPITVRGAEAEFVTTTAEPTGAPSPRYVDQLELSQTASEDFRRGNSISVQIFDLKNNPLGDLSVRLYTNKQMFQGIEATFATRKGETLTDVINRLNTDLPPSRRIDHFNWFQMFNVQNVDPDGIDVETTAGQPIRPHRWYVDPGNGGWLITRRLPDLIGNSRGPVIGTTRDWADSLPWYLDETPAPKKLASNYDPSMQLSARTQAREVKMVDVPRQGPKTEVVFQTYLVGLNAKGAAPLFILGFQWRLAPPGGILSSVIPELQRNAPSVDGFRLSGFPTDNTHTEYQDRYMRLVYGKYRFLAVIPDVSPVFPVNQGAGSIYPWQAKIRAKF